MQYSSNSTVNTTNKQQPNLKSAFTALTDRFYKSEDGKWSDACNKKYGLEQPLWVWTHRALTHATSSGSSHDDSTRMVEVTRIEHLLNWLTMTSHVLGSNICVVVTSAQKASLAKLFNKKAAVANAPLASNRLGGKHFNTSSSYETKNFQESQEQITFVDHQELLMMSNQPQQQQPNQTMNVEQKKFAIVIFAFGLPLMQKHFDFVAGAGTKALTIAAEMVSDAMVIICDAGWVYSGVLKQLTPEWFAVCNDVFRQQMPVIRLQKSFVANSLTSPAAASTMGMIAGVLPICCPEHPQKRHLADGNSPFEGFCDAICLKPYICKENDAVRIKHTKLPTSSSNTAGIKFPHLCNHRCHLSSQSTHNCCPYPCNRQLEPCGGTCLANCHDRCQCGHTTEVPLPCSHEVVVGFDKDTFAPVTEKVFHVFKGKCSDAASTACQVMVPTICAHCAADFIAPCHVLTGLGHTLNGVRTAVCEQCVRKQREIRAQARGDLIREIHEKRKQAQADLKTQQYIRNQSGGIVLQEGQRVAISDPSAVREPIESDFPDFKFLDFYDPQFQSKIIDAHGLVMTAVAEGDELQYVVRLYSGLNVLVAESGLQAVKAIGNVASTGAMLLLTAAPGMSLDTTSDNQSSAAASTTAFSTRIRPLCGKFAIVLEPISYVPPRNLIALSGSGEGYGSLQQDSYTTPESDAQSIKLTNIVGTIVGEDVELTLRNEEPMVQLQTTFWFAGAAATTNTDAIDDEPAAKKCRAESTGTPSTTARTNSSVTVIVPTPLRLLEIIELKEAKITQTDRQIRGKEASELFEYAATEVVKSHQKNVAKSGSVAPALVTIRDAPAIKDEMFSVIGIVNHPVERDGAFDAQLDLDEEGLLKTKGPCVVLLSRLSTTARTSTSRRHGANGNQPITAPSPASLASPASTSVVVAPLLYVDVDEEAAVERQLTTQILARLDVVAKERYDKYCEDTSFANEDRRFVDQQLLPTPKKIEDSEADQPGAADGEPTQHYAITETLIAKNKMSPLAASEGSALQQRPSTHAATYIQVYSRGSSNEAATDNALLTSDTTEALMAAPTTTTVNGEQHGTTRGGRSQSQGTSQPVTEGHVGVDRLTPQQRRAGVWAYSYSIPTPLLSAAEVAALNVKREQMPKVPSALQLEFTRKRQDSVCVQPSVKAVEIWSNLLSSTLLVGQESDKSYAKSVNEVVTAECLKKGIHVGVAVGKR